MSTEFNPNDRVSINKDLTYTAPRFGVGREMREIFTGTVTHNIKSNDEVTIMLDYPDDVPECHRPNYSYDPRDLTLISRKPLHFKLKDRVKVESLKHTRDRFGIVEKMSEILTGTVDYVDENLNEIQLKLDGDDDDVYLYDPRDLTLISRTFEPNDKVLINKDLPYTTPRFGTSKDMREFSTGIVVYVDENDVVDGAVATRVHLDTDRDTTSDYFYDPRDLTLISNEPKPKRKKGIPVLDDFDNSNGFPTPTNVKTSNNKTTVEFSDNTTTSVTKSAGDPYDLETAIAYCIAKKIVTNSCIKHLAKNAKEVNDKVTTEFYNKFLNPYGFKNGGAYFDVEIETLKDYLKTLNDVRAEMALIAIENDLTKDELLDRLKG